ncbi:MAG: hypothetical protein KF833_07315 [Verrucomicrobiae bacterium]|nr:hypothetical protein [Verrucomicrobiae bacterium]
MAEVLPLSDAERILLESLTRHQVRFLVVGLSAAALQGAPVVTQDIDLWFEDLADQRMAAALREVGAAYVPPFDLNPPMLAGPGSDPFDIVLRMDGLRGFAREFEDAIPIRVAGLSLPVLPLARIIASKTASNRPKDQAVLPALKDALTSINASPIHPLASPPVAADTAPLDGPPSVHEPAVPGPNPDGPLPRPDRCP